MSDRPIDDGDRSDTTPLFQDMDSSSDLNPANTPPESLDSAEGDVTRESVVGSEGTYRAPTVPAATTPTSAAVPPTAVPDLLTDNQRDDDLRERE